MYLLDMWPAGFTRYLKMTKNVSLEFWLKITQNVAFQFLNSGIFHQFFVHFKIDLSGNTV